MKCFQMLGISVCAFYNGQQRYQNQGSRYAACRGTQMACLRSVVLFAYNYHDERFQIFSAASFDSEDYSKLPFLVTRKSTSKPVLQWHNDNNCNRRTELGGKYIPEQIVSWLV